MPGKQRLWLAALLALISSRVAAAPAPADPMATCTRRLEGFGRALAAYQRDHKALPPNLSDLYPRYVKDVRQFHCPADPTPGQPGYVGAKPDPNMPISYFYEMSLEKDPAGLLFGPEPASRFKTWRELKLAQRRYFGDRVPVVRCWHHSPRTETPATYAGVPVVLSLTPSGRVYRSVPAWEWDAATVPVLLANIERDLKAGPARFRSIWMPIPTAQYFSALQRVTPETSLRMQKVAEQLAAAGKTDPAMAEGGMLTLIGSLYRTSGYAAKAVTALEKAVRATGDRRLAASLLADLYHRTGKDDQAIRFLQEMLAKEPDNVQAMALLARAYNDDGQTEKADEWQGKVDNWLLGEAAPDFALKDGRGKEIRLSERRGKVVVLLFWHPHSEASGWAASYMEELNQKHRGQGIAFFCLDEQATHADTKGIARYSFTFPLLLDAGPVFRRYGVLHAPTTYVIDSTGRVALRRVGFDYNIARSVESAVKRLLPSESASVGERRNRPAAAQAPRPASSHRWRRTSRL